MTIREWACHIGLLLLRVAIGCFMLVHGWQKLANFDKLADTFPDPIGMGSQLSLIAAIGAEVGCSLLLIIGLGTRLAALPLGFTMIIALFVIHPADPWQKRELAAIYLSAYAVIVFTGAGKFSLDEMVRSKWSRRATASSSDAGEP